MEQAQRRAQSREPIVTTNAYLEDKEVTSFDENAQLLQFLAVLMQLHHFIVDLVL